MRRETRAADDGYRSELVPGLRASADAERLAAEIAFSAARLLALAAEPPGLYGLARTLGARDLERATWTCLLIAYLQPLEGPEPFAGITAALGGDPAAAPAPWEPGTGAGLPDLEGVELGPRTSHDPARGGETLEAYLQWVARASAPGQAAEGDPAGQAPGPSGPQAQALTGDPGWSAERRFERVFERLALPGLGRTGRFELLLTLGRLGLYELRPDSLHLGSERGQAREDATVLAAKRVFGIAERMLLERRSAALADACAVPLEALDLALFNWAAPERATAGFPLAQADETALDLARGALGL